MSRTTDGKERFECVCGCYYYVPYSEPNPPDYCSDACETEHARESGDRPDDLDDLLEELYLDLDLNMIQTFKRVNVAIRVDDYSEDDQVMGGYRSPDLTQDEVRERLIDLGIHNRAYDRGSTRTKELLRNLREEFDSADEEVTH